VGVVRGLIGSFDPFVSGFSGDDELSAQCAEVFCTLRGDNELFSQIFHSFTLQWHKNHSLCMSFMKKI
ncbi:MAG: hypothetical protein SOR56_02540, partial [Oscillospiraceae bacterium]|nr:hypothetical protein [Oscillospiraceae bacterium]